MATIFGSLFILLYPPFTGADEEAHFARAYSVANGNFVMESGSTVDMPSSYLKTIGCMQTKTPIPGSLYRYKYDEYANSKKEAIKCALSLDSRDSATDKVKDAALGYSPVAYIPQALTIIFANFIKLPIVIIDYLVRFSVLFAYIILIVIAINIIPVRKWALVGVALLPYSLTHVTNPGVDYMLYGSIAIFVATIVSSWYPAQTNYSTKSSYIMLTLSSLMMVLSKGIFPGILFLPLLVFYGNIQAHWRAKVLIISLSIISTLLWQKSGGIKIVGDAGGDGASFILSFPVAFLKTQFYEWTGFDLLYRGYRVSWDEIGTPSAFISLTNGLIFMLLMIRYSNADLKNGLSKQWRKALLGMSLLIGVGVVVGSFAAMYIAASYLQDDSFIIRGVQQRYFYPALFMLAILPFGRWFVAKERTFKLVVIFGSILSLLSVVMVLLLRYKWGIFG